MFGTADKVPPNWPAIPKTPAEAALANAMLDYWASFARTGVPAAAGQPEWRAYGADRHYLSFEDAPRLKTHVYPDMYELYEQVVCRRRAAGGPDIHCRRPAR